MNEIPISAIQNLIFRLFRPFLKVCIEQQISNLQFSRKNGVKVFCLMTAEISSVFFSRIEFENGSAIFCTRKPML